MFFVSFYKYQTASVPFVNEGRDKRIGANESKGS